MQPKPFHLREIPVTRDCWRRSARKWWLRDGRGRKTTVFRTISLWRAVCGRYVRESKFSVMRFGKRPCPECLRGIGGVYPLPYQPPAVPPSTHQETP